MRLSRDMKPSLSTNRRHTRRTSELPLLIGEMVEPFVDLLISVFFLGGLGWHVPGLSRAPT